MSELINDGSLVVFSPLNEPSGAPTFRNLAPRFLTAAMSYDWHPMIAANTYADQVLSLHPGGGIVDNIVSGASFPGYSVQGVADTNTQNSSFSNKALVWGIGQSTVRSLMAPPDIAQSGFTLGIWIYPNSNGAWESVKNVDNASNAERHTLVGRGNNVDGFVLGVSGLMERGAQFDNGLAPGVRHGDELRAFIHVRDNNLHLDVPIESGKYTHIAFTYRYIDGSANQVVLYKDGRVAASGTANEELGTSNTSYADRPLLIGGSHDSSNFDNGFEFTSGWGHLVSGIYGFDRPLHEGELLELHDSGGLQPNGSFTEGKNLDLSDSSLVAYVPMIETAFVDVSPNHFNFFSDRDLGSDGRLNICPGPFNRAMAFKDDTTDDIAIATGSGVIQSIMDGNGSFSIGGWFYVRGTADFNTNTLISLGSIGTAELTPLRFTGGFHISTSGADNGHAIFARVYDGGIVDQQHTATFVTPGVDMYNGVMRHVSLVYDAQTRGMAFYVDKRQVGSGTMATPFEDVVTRLAGSGYPFVFLNGVTQDTTDLFDINAGDDCAVGEMFVFNRPLEPQEIIAIAESGIDITPLYYTRHDPRLRGYWTGTDQETNDLIFPDEALSMRGAAVPGNLTKALSDLQWDTIYNNRDTTQHSKVDLISVSRGAQGGDDDVYDGPLGFTSGSFVVMGGSHGIHQNTAAVPNRLTSSVSNPSRYRPVADSRDTYSQHIINHYAIAFDVTPSGIIPATADGNTAVNNCNLLAFGEASSQDRLISYLTTQDGPGSGVVIRFDTRDGAIQQNLIQASIPYGIPSRIAFTARPITPYDNIANHETNGVQVSIYVDGQLVNTVQHQSDLADIWSDRPVSSPTLWDWQLSIGGRPISDSDTTHITLDSGLGDIHLRNISLWVGALSDSDINHIATSGVISSSKSGYTDSVGLETVTTSDPNLKGYWRFAGESPQSGVVDYSIAGNNLTNLAQSMQEQAGGPAFANSDNTSNNILFIPGPFANSLFPLRGSGLTHASNSPLSAANAIAPMAVSGVDFENPNNGFTVGLWLAPREVTGTNLSKYVVSYGPTPTAATGTEWVDASWALTIDEIEDIVFYLSKDGRMPTDSSSSEELVTRAQIRRDSFSPSNTFDIQKEGAYGPGHVDSIIHLIFSYDATSNILKGYLNGEQVTRAAVDPSGFHTPLSVDARIISFLSPQVSAPWSFGITQDDPDSVIFEPFYMNRSINDNEARSIATKGISQPITTTISGVIGGFITSIDTSSGVIGGFTRGFQTYSGIIGGFIDSVNARDLRIGGFVQGQDSISGIIGGYLNGVNNISDIIGSYVQASSQCSGIIGGYVRAGLLGNVQFDSVFRVKSLATADFDASIQITASNTQEFDAQISVFRAEVPPVVSIVTPAEDVSGVLTPFSQYFVGRAVATSGRTITKAAFTFSDFSSQLVVAESGNHLFAPATDHTFNQSGVYVVRFSVIDSEGQHASAIRVINLASGISPVEITLSGVPEAGNAPLSVQFAQVQESVPTGVGVVANLLDFDDGITTISLNQVHKYTEPGIYIPIWIVRDSRGFIWSDSLTVGINN